MHEVFPEDADLPGRPLARARPAGERPVRAVRQLDRRAAAQPRPTSRASRSRWPRRSTSPTGAASTTAPARSATSCRTTCCRCSPACSPTRRPAPGCDAWRDGEGAARSTALRPLTPGHHGARPVRRLPRRRRRRARARPPRPTSPSGCTLRLVALGGRPDPHPGRQVHAGHRHRGRASGSGGRRTTSSACEPFGRPTRCGSGSGRRARSALTLVGKKPGAGWSPQGEDLVVRRRRPAPTCAPTTG